MTPPDGISLFASAKGLPRDADGPVFTQPWQAQAFALTVRLSEEGYFTWREWANELSIVLRETTTPDDGSHYYEHWLLALERLCLAKNLTDLSALNQRKTAWEEAYRRTPHGKPVELSR